MQKEIVLKGFTENPSDYECPDGELASAMGLVPEDSTMKPILPPKVMFPLAEGEEFFYVHKGNGYTHYIKKKGSKIIFGNAELHDFLSAEIYEGNSVGNTLLILTSAGMHYFLWVDNAYKDLGDHLPDLPLEFGLYAHRYSSGEFSVRYDKEVIINVEPWTDIFPPTEEQFIDFAKEHSIDYGYSNNYSDDLKNAVTQGVMAQVNKHIEDYKKYGFFLFPFFVRYAYRLYDGSITMHSAPVLMTIASQQNPYVAIKGVHRTEDEIVIEDNHAHYHIHSQDIKCVLYFAYSSLCYKVLDESFKTALGNWKDIISSVDIFISEPLWTIDQSGLCTGVNHSSDRFGGHSICQTHGFYSDEYKGVTDTEMFNGLELLQCPIVKLPLKAITQEQITANSRFYLLASIKPENLSTWITPVSIPQDYLRSLSSRELMTDDYDSHDKLMPTKSFTYNSRLNITGIQKGFGTYYNLSTIPYSDGSSVVRFALWVFIKTDQGERIKAFNDYGVFGSLVNSNIPVHYLYFPYSGAYQAILQFGNYYRKLPLSPHPFLNGSYFFSDWNTDPETMGSGGNNPQSLVNNNPISLPNKLYTSEVNNPFFFPVSGIVTIGAANILDISSAAKALSEGQFGQFPLYAFTDEGVWALELSDTGSYKARQPITRDVCISSESITQIDSAVLFATDRGIMMISGSNAICISDELTTNNSFDSSKLPNLDKVLQDYAEEENITYVPFLDYIKGCRMIYDYVHQRIIVFNPETEIINGQQVRKYSYAYVYSLKSKKWGMMYSTIAGTVNSYPNALAVTKEGTKQTVVDYSAEKEVEEGQSLTGLKGVIITRPIKLDEPDTLKTVNTVITRGKFKKGHVKTILYGSRDLENWHLIASSVDHTLRYLHGTPYKYFRLVLLCDLEKGENIISSTIEYTNKYADQIR